MFVSEWAADLIYTVSSITVIVAGVIAYWSSGVREKYADQHLSDTQADALRARDSSNKAKVEAANANERAALANVRAGEANDRAGQAHERAAVAERETARALLQLQDEQDERVSLMRAVAPRDIGFELSSRDVPLNIMRLAKFKGVKVILRSINEDEPIDVAKRLAGLLPNVGWEVHRDVLADNEVVMDGIHIEQSNLLECQVGLPPEEQAEALRKFLAEPVEENRLDALNKLRDAAETLVEFLEVQAISAHTMAQSDREQNPLPPDTLRITIGKRPSTYFFTALHQTPAQRKEMRESELENKRSSEESKKQSREFRKWQEEDRRAWGAHLPAEQQQKFLIDATNGVLTEKQWETMAETLHRGNAAGFVKVTFISDNALSAAVARVMYAAFPIRRGVGGSIGLLGFRDSDPPAHDGIVVFGSDDNPLVTLTKEALTTANIPFRTATESDGFKLSPQFENLWISVGRMAGSDEGKPNEK